MSPSAESAPETALAGVVLAAGASSRFAGGPKQLAAWRGETLVHRAVRVARGRLDPVLAVVGHAEDRVREALADLVEEQGVRVVPNPSWQAGQSTSVRAAVAALGPASLGGRRLEAAVFLPCDQPFLDESVLDELLAAWRHRRPDIRALVPVYLDATGERRSGAPVVFASTLFPALRSLTGDQGGRQILDGLGDAVGFVDLPEDARAYDVDTVEDLAHLQSAEESS